MIHAMLHANGTGTVELPGRTVPVTGDTIGEARAAAIAVLTSYAAAHAGVLEVTVSDDGEAVRLAVHPDGQVAVARGNEPLPAADVAGPPLAALPAEDESAQTYTPAAPAAPLEEPQADMTAGLRDRSHRGDDDFDMTVIVEPHAADPTATLEFSTGETVNIDGTTLVGRKPEANTDEEVDDVVTIADDTRTVSKTHFMVAWHDGDLWIVDRGSGNGTVIHHAGDRAVTLRPDAGHVLSDGDRVEIGDQDFTVRISSGVQA